MRKIVAKVLSVLGKVPQDKLLHFVAGMLIVGVTALCVPLAPYAWIPGVIAGACKEWYDRRNGGDADVWDFAATVFGAVAMQGLVWLYLLAW